MLRFLLALAALVASVAAQAHPAPFSYLDVRYEDRGLVGTLTVHEFDLMHDRGISREGDILDLASERGLLEKSGTWYSF